MINNFYNFYLTRYSLITIELVIFILIFIFRSEKRKFWYIGVLLTIAMSIGIFALIHIPLSEYYKSINYNQQTISIITSLLHIFLLSLITLGFARSFKTSLYELFSNVYLGYALRQIVFSIYSVILNITNPDLLFIRIGQQNLLNFGLYLLIYGLLIIISIILSNKLIKNPKLTLEWPIFIIMTIVVILNTVILSFAEVVSDEHLISFTFVLLSQILILLLIIVLNFYTQKHINLKLSKNLSETLLKKQEEQYKFAKANAELLYVKAHDLKHQVAILRKGGEDAEKILSELESVISNYDSVALTDNTVMNIILSEKWQYCTKHNIKLSYTVDPNAFTQMDNVHLYTLLANILDNAIEAVMKIKDKNKRLISLSISHKKGVSLLKTYNYFSGNLTLEDGLPKTNKKDKNMHGYGLKSIQHITNLYQGEVSLNIEKDIFNLQISIFDK